jgi:hypothetical protein
MKSKRLQLPLLELEWLNIIALAICVANLALIWFLLTRIDEIVNVQLYFYGLNFSHNWSDQYQTVLHLTMIFIFWSVALNLIVTGIGLNRIRKKAAKEKEGLEIQPAWTPEGEPEAILETPRTSKEAPQPRPKQEYRPLKESTENLQLKNRALTCPHCKRPITKALAVLDFSNDNMRLVNVCPHCKLVLGTISVKQDVKQPKPSDQQN